MVPVKQKELVAHEKVGMVLNDGCLSTCLKCSLVSERLWHDFLQPSFNEGALTHYTPGSWHFPSRTEGVGSFET